MLEKIVEAYEYVRRKHLYYSNWYWLNKLSAGTIDIYSDLETLIVINKTIKTYIKKGQPIGFIGTARLKLRYDDKTMTKLANGLTKNVNHPMVGRFLEYCINVGLKSDFLEKYIDFFNDYSVHAGIVASSLTYIKSQTTHKVALEAIEMFKEVKEKEYMDYDKLTNIIEVVTENQDSERACYYLKCIGKYCDNNFDAVVGAFKKNRKMDPIILKEFLLAYDTVKNSRNPEKLIKYILEEDYARIRINLPDDVKFDVSYEDMDLAVKTYRFISEIHKDREHQYFSRIHVEFFREMKRAIEQGKDLKSKKRYLNQYCREVMAKMKENAGELMFHA